MYTGNRNMKCCSRKVFGSNKTKGFKHDSQYLLKLPTPEGGEP